MSCDTPAPNPLTYAAPAQPADIQVYRDEDGVTIECGPMSTATFIATLAPRALHFGLLIGLVAWFYHTRQRPLEWFFWLMTGVGVIGSILLIVRLARYRMIPRMVGATRDVVYYRDASTAGRVIELPRQDLSSIGVRRSAFGLYHVCAVPKKRKFWTLKSSSTEPVVLLTGRDRLTLHSIAAALRDVPENASSS